MSDPEACRLHLQFLRHSLFSPLAFEYCFKHKAEILSEFGHQAKWVTESCACGFCLTKSPEMLRENSEMGIPSSILHAVEPLALTPLGGHPLYDYQTSCSVYATSLHFCSLLSCLLSNLCLWILTTSCPGTESCWFYVCKLCIRYGNCTCMII